MGSARLGRVPQEAVLGGPGGCGDWLLRSGAVPGGGGGGRGSRNLHKDRLCGM